MSTDKSAGDCDNEIDDDRLDATTRNMVLNIAEELSSVDGPLVGDGEPERVEELVDEMVEAIGLPRMSYAEADADDLVVEAEGDDTYWRKHSNGFSARAICGPFNVRGRDRDDHITIDEGWMEVTPNGQDQGIVTIDTHLEGEYQGIEYEQGALHELTPRQARAFAAALLEQAEYVDEQSEE